MRHTNCTKPVFTDLLNFKSSKEVLLFSSLFFLLAIFEFLPKPSPATSLPVACACEDTLNGSLDQECKFTLTGGVIFEDTSSGCNYPVTLIVRFGFSDTLAVGVLDSVTDTVQVRGAYAYVNQYITVDAFDNSNFQLCSPAILVEDKLAPFLICSDTTINCNADTSPASTGFPDLSDNCDNNISLTYSDEVEKRDCANPDGFIAVIRRQWVGEDASGNRDTCVQTINLRKAELSQITVSSPVYVSCDNPDTDPSLTGFPLLDGIPVTNLSPCNLMIFGPDDSNPIPTCSPTSFKIIRGWDIMDTCTNVTQRFEQVIEVVDTILPTVACAPLIEVGTDAGQCAATVNLPMPTITDNCTIKEVNAMIDGIGIGFGPFQNVPTGTYNVTYTVKDCSDRPVECQSVLTVVDREEPTAICREFTVVSLNTTGIAVVPAGVFDEGSYDNCDDVGFLASRDGVNFTPTILFDCADAGQDSIMVVLRVFELSNPDRFDHCMIMVAVQEKLRPIVNCPPGRTVDCDFDYSDLSVFGTPTVIEACAFNLSDTTIFNLDMCGVGTIERKFSATDVAGNTGVCTQIITVKNLTPFNGNGIVWPLDTTFRDCTTALHPDSLDLGYDRPVLPDDTCAMLALNYADQQFNTSFPACYKVFRKWTLLDWCTGNKYSHTQVIKVMDSVKPILTCPADITAAASATCSMNFVAIPSAIVNDCDPAVTISNNSPYAMSGAADASGTYPVGTTEVEFIANDRCGNFSTCSTSVTVQDMSPPTVSIVDRLAIELGSFNGNVSATLEAQAFDAGVRDNCSLRASLDFFIRLRRSSNPTPPTTTELVFDCDDIGLDSVEVWVVDEAGNADFTIAGIEVQDNNNLCSGIRPFVAISGFLKKEDGTPLKNAEVKLIGGAVKSATTDQQGYYQFENLPKGGNYTVIPEKDDDLLNGVTTYDLMKIGKHVLNLAPLSSPFKMIAADANNTSTITTLDVVTVRKAILRMEAEFPNNKSWRFVKKDYVFPDPAAPLRQPLQSVITYENLRRDVQDADFVAVKVGDVNGNANGNLDIITNRSLHPAYSLVSANRKFTAGEEVEVQLKMDASAQLSGFQFTIDFDPARLAVRDIEPAALAGLDADNFGWSLVPSGKLPVSWHTAKAQKLPKGEIIFKLVFEAISNGSLKEHLRISSDPTEAEIYADGLVRPVELKFENINRSEQYQLFQNQPNPFRNETVISFYVPEATPGAIKILDLAGKVVYQVTREWPHGFHELSLSRNELPQSGVFFYQLETPKYTSTRKMILL